VAGVPLRRKALPQSLRDSSLQREPKSKTAERKEVASSNGGGGPLAVVGVLLRRKALPQSLRDSPLTRGPNELASPNGGGGPLAAAGALILIIYIPNEPSRGPLG
jgi:hypothetical protein